MGKLSSKMPKPKVATPAQVAAGIEVLRRGLWSERWHNQGGYVCRSKNGWDFASSPVGQFTPDEMDALFAMAGLTPDVIDPLGSCSECKHAEVAPNGKRYERGWVGGKCPPCERPRMTNFEPVEVSKS